jgi:hypothetical protein
MPAIVSSASISVMRVAAAIVVFFEYEPSEIARTHLRQSRQGDAFTQTSATLRTEPPAPNMVGTSPSLR